MKSWVIENEKMCNYSEKDKRLKMKFLRTEIKGSTTKIDRMGNKRWKGQTTKNERANDKKIKRSNN